MKTSNKYVLGIACAAIVAVIVLVSLSRLFLTKVADWGGGDGTEILASVETITREVDTAPFSGIQTSGSWHVSISRGAEPSVSVTIAKNLFDELEIDVQGGILQVGFKPDTRIRELRLAEIEIVIPRLEHVGSSGTLDIEFAGFEGKRLSLESSGILNIHGRESGYDFLDAKTSGAADIRLADITVEGAEVEMSGTGSAEIRTGSGALTGRLSGASRLTYFGSPSRVDVETSGASRLVRADK